MSITGREGEDVAAAYLEGKGFSVIGRNYHTRYGEIDIIVEDDEYMVFVEVKARSSERGVMALESVTPAKRGRLRKTAEIWLATHENKRQPRFDVIEVYRMDEKTRINHIENAF